MLGTRIGTDNNALAPVVAPFLSSLGSSGLLDQPGAAELVAEPSIQLLRALVATHLADPALAREPLESSLTLRVQQYIRTHLAERDLNAARIAAAHHISVRHLYATMARAGISVHRTIQHQRLEACRRDLRDPACAHLAAATVGARWGFVDPSHFGRVVQDRVRADAQRVAGRISSLVRGPSRRGSGPDSVTIDKSGRMHLTVRGCTSLAGAPSTPYV